LYAPATGKFWKYSQISYDKFLQEADTFDILLVNGNSKFASITKAFTQSEFSHIAMIMRVGSELKVLEASASAGVVIRPLEIMIDKIGDSTD
jgi:hypothetical protein